MFENYERVTDRAEQNVYCEKCERYHEDCYTSADCVEYLTKKLWELENALEDGLLVELTPERVLAVMACAYGTVSNKKATDILVGMVEPQLDAQKAGD